MGKSSRASDLPLNSDFSSWESIFEEDPVTYTVALVESIRRRRKSPQSGTSWISSKKRKQPCSFASGCMAKKVSTTSLRSSVVYGLSRSSSKLKYRIEVGA